jgi:hypothetical protein
VQFIKEVILVPSDSESDLDSEPDTEQSSVKSDEESEEPYDSYEEDLGNDSTHSGSHFDSDDESINPDNDYRKMLTLGQTVTLFDHQVNICYDSSSTLSVLSADVRIPGVVEDVKETRNNPAGGGPLPTGILPLVTVPLPLEGGGIGAAKVVVKGVSFPIMTVDPSPDTIAKAMDLPPGVFAPRREGAVQLILGTDEKAFVAPFYSSFAGSCFSPSIFEEPHRRGPGLCRLSCRWLEEQERNCC